MWVWQAWAKARAWARQSQSPKMAEGAGSPGRPVPEGYQLRPLRALVEKTAGVWRVWCPLVLGSSGVWAQARARVKPRQNPKFGREKRQARQAVAL